MTVPVTRTNYTPEELRDLAKRCSNGAQARRAITLIMEGHSRQDAAKTQNMDRQTLHDWVHRYNEFGPEGLNNRPKSGRKVFLDKGQLKVISDWLEKGPDPETDGLVRWCVQDVKNKIQTNFSVNYSMEGGCRPRIVNSENLQSVDFQRLFKSGPRRFKAEIGNFVTKRRSGRGFWPASCVWGCPGRQDAAERWLKCGTLDVCDASEIFTNIELHPGRNPSTDAEAGLLSRFAASTSSQGEAQGSREIS